MGLLPAIIRAAPATSPGATSRPAITLVGQPTTAPAAKGIIATRDGQRLLVPVTTHDGARTQLKVFESRDFGQSCNPLPGVVDADDARGCDMGDAALLEAADGTLWISYRHNHAGDDPPRYAIKTARSRDGGATWEPPIVVAESRGERGRPSRGLWASFLFQRSDGTIQCYYDDEDTPFTVDRAGHQFITMKTWDATAGTWGKPVTASRAHDANDLSRDGMMSVVELSPNHLLMVFESVQTARPHANVLRSVTSDDGGATWSWHRRERDVVYQPPRTDGAFMALAPWMVRCNDGRLVVVFCTDEDRDRPFVSGTPVHRMRVDVKAILSNDNGTTWSASRPIFDTSHHYYLPGVAARNFRGQAELIFTALDFSDAKCKAVRGELK